jgi:hypothetical protein
MNQSNPTEKSERKLTRCLCCGKMNAETGRHVEMTEGVYFCAICIDKATQLVSHMREAGEVPKAILD